MGNMHEETKENTEVILEKIRSGKIKFDAIDDTSHEALFRAEVGSYILELTMRVTDGRYCRTYALWCDDLLLDVDPEEVYELLHGMESDRKRQEDDQKCTQYTAKISKVMETIRAL